MENKSCPKCSGICVKNGKIQNRQRLRCKECNHNFMAIYRNLAWQVDLNKKIVVLLKEGCGIRSIARILQISPTTLQKRIRAIALEIKKPPICFGQKYEVDELCTYVGDKGKRIWVAYALASSSGTIVDFVVGRRTNRTLNQLIGTLLLAKAQKINTDKLRNYRSLVPQPIHYVKQYGTNHIERMNLTLRTHLKRLNRRTLCYSKSVVMLSACLRIYFWG